MSVATGIIRDGQLVLEGDDEPLPEGRRFTLIVEDEEKGFHLAMADIDRGDVLSEEEVFAEMKRLT